MRGTRLVQRSALAAVFVLVLAPLPGQGADPKVAASKAAGSLAATEGDELPAAVLGGAPAPLGENVAYFPGDPAARGYLAVPSGQGPFGAVILIHEWNGLVDRVRKVADALAAEGYVALAADLYSGRTGASREQNLALARETLRDPDRIIANLD